MNVETIRYYERVGLLAAPTRTLGGHRDYGDGAMVTRLDFIRRARDLGFSLDDVRALLLLSDEPHPCGEVSALAKAHLAEVRRKLVDLAALERRLALLSDPRAPAPAGSLLDALSATKA